MEKIKRFFKKNKRLICTFLGIGAVAVSGMAAMAYRERRRRTDLPTPKHDSREGSKDRVAELVHSGITDSIKRAGENIRELDDYEQRIGELYRQAQITAEKLANELADAERRNGELEARLCRITDSARAIGYRIDRSGELGCDIIRASQAIADTIDDFERISGLGDNQNSGTEIEPDTIRNPDGIIEGIVPGVDE